MKRDWFFARLLRRRRGPTPELMRPETPAAALPASDAVSSDELPEFKRGRREQAKLRRTVVSEEIDRLTVDAAERGRSVDGKASFLAVASGIVITAAAALAESVSAVLGILPMAFCGAALVAATVALRPTKRRDIAPDLLAARWLDSERGLDAVEFNLLEEKIVNYAARETSLQRRPAVTTGGFVLLLVGVFTLVLDYWLILND